MVMGGLPLLLVSNEVKSSKMTVNAENSNSQAEVTVKE